MEKNGYNNLETADNFKNSNKIDVLGEKDDIILESNLKT